MPDPRASSHLMNSFLEAQSGSITLSMIAFPHFSFAAKSFLRFSSTLCGAEQSCKLRCLLFAEMRVAQEARQPASKVGQLTVRLGISCAEWAAVWHMLPLDGSEPASRVRRRHTYLLVALAFLLFSDGGKLAEHEELKCLSFSKSAGGPFFFLLYFALLEYTDVLIDFSPAKRLAGAKSIMFFSAL